MLTDVEREHLFLLGLGRPPEVRYRAPDGVSPRLQRVLDALEFSPAIVKTPTWDVVAWNRAAAAVLTDYRDAAAGEAQHPAPDLLRSARARRPGRLGGGGAVRGRRRSGPMSPAPGRRRRSRRWSTTCRARARNSRPCGRDNDVRSYGEGTKHLNHPVAGPIAMEFSTFAVDGRPDLGLVVYNPATPADADKVRALIAAKAAARPRETHSGNRHFRRKPVRTVRLTGFGDNCRRCRTQVREHDRSRSQPVRCRRRLRRAVGCACLRPPSSRPPA